MVRGVAPAELVVALVMRTRRRFFRSRPGTLLLRSTVIVIVAALAIPYLPSAGLFGFVPPPTPQLGLLVLITIMYVAATEVAKRRFCEANF